MWVLKRKYNHNILRSTMSSCFFEYKHNNSGNWRPENIRREVSWESQEWGVWIKLCWKDEEVPLEPYWVPRNILCSKGRTFLHYSSNSIVSWMVSNLHTNHCLHWPFTLLMNWIWINWLDTKMLLHYASLCNC